MRDILIKHRIGGKNEKMKKNYSIFLLIILIGLISVVSVFAQEFKNQAKTVTTESSYR